MKTLTIQMAINDADGKPTMALAEYKIDLGATDEADNEANAQRRISQLVTELFQRARHKLSGTGTNADGRRIKWEVEP